MSETNTSSRQAKVAQDIGTSGRRRYFPVSLEILPQTKRQLKKQHFLNTSRECMLSNCTNWQRVWPFKSHIHFTVNLVIPTICRITWSQQMARDIHLFTKTGWNSTLGQNQSKTERIKKKKRKRTSSMCGYVRPITLLSGITCIFGKPGFCSFVN